MTPTVLQFSTQDILEKPVSTGILHQLAQHAPIDLKTGHIMRTVLHEALLNAAIHGNLHIGSFDIRHMPDEIAHASQNRELMQKQVSVNYSWQDTAWHFSVHDQGHGFDTVATLLALDQAAAASTNGRGLRLIRAMTHNMYFDNNGSSIYFSINRINP